MVNRLLILTLIFSCMLGLGSCITINTPPSPSASSTSNPQLQTTDSTSAPQSDNAKSLAIWPINPPDGCVNFYPNSAPVFSWYELEIKGVTKYWFQLSANPSFQTQLMNTATTGDNAGGNYTLPLTLDYHTSYFWRVKPLEVNGHEIEEDWSKTFSFETGPPPPPPRY